MVVTPMPCVRMRRSTVNMFKCFQKVTQINLPWEISEAIIPVLKRKIAVSLMFLAADFCSPLPEEISPVNRTRVSL
jgi:hypothetical protein